MSKHLPGFILESEGKLSVLLDEFNKKRKAALNQASIAAVVLLLTGILIAGLIYVKSSLGVGLIFIILFLIVCIAVYFMTLKSFAKDFKKKFFKEVLLETIPDINYITGTSMAPYLINKAGFFENYNFLDAYSRIDAIKVDDQFKGTRGKTEFSLSEVVTYKSISEQSSTKMFVGLFIECTLKNKIKPLVITNKNARYKIIKMSKYGLKKIYIKDEENFNSKYDILRYKQSPIDKFPFGEKFLKGLDEIERVFGDQIYISLRQNKAYVAIEKSKDFFEPNFLQPISLKTVLKIYGELIYCLMVVDIIDELNHGTPNPNLKQIDE